MNQKLYRSRTQKVLGGVCGGLGEYLNLDPVLVRVIFIVLAFFHGFGLILYVIMLVIVPQKPIVWQMPGETAPIDTSTNVSTDEAQQSTVFETSQLKQEPSKGKVIAGIVLIVLGVVFLFENIWPIFDFENFFPIILVGIGIVILWNALRK
ncbi:MAG: PspC domain-containing protein [Bacteroidetes bacterium]|nr:PspC domain-containing protein [Bacteroidota bacterium]MBU2585751.1 PspC domain-containing protein [Bacteroidota bacterium]